MYGVYTKNLTVPWGGDIRVSFVSRFSNGLNTTDQSACLELVDSKTGKIIAQSKSDHNVQILEFHNQSVTTTVTIRVKPSNYTKYNQVKLEGTLSWWQS